MGVSSRCCDGRHTKRQGQANQGRRRCSSFYNGEESVSSDSEVEVSPFVSRYDGLTSCHTTESLRQVDVICGSHTYTVAGYTLARAMGPGTRLCSDVFEVGGQLFRLEVYPAGLNRDTANYVSLYITTPGTTCPGHLLYELSILDKTQSKPQHITEARTAHPPSPSEPATVMVPHAGTVASFPKFIKANFLHRNPRRFLPDDTLTVRATIKILTGRSSFPMTPPLQPQLFTLYPSTPPGLSPLPLAQQAPTVLPAGAAALGAASWAPYGQSAAVPPLNPLSPIASPLNPCSYGAASALPGSPAAPSWPYAPGQALPGTQYAGVSPGMGMMTSVPLGQLLPYTNAPFGWV